MSLLYINKNACSCCGHIIKRWNGYPYTDNEGSLCLRCHIQALLVYAKEIEISKQLIGAALSPANKSVWDAKNGQEKKISELLKSFILTITYFYTFDGKVKYIKTAK